jgi:SpoVK/Ycf46/Vps4 family AAA+-type ATPase
VSYPDLLSKFVGDTEKGTKAVFAEAAQAGKVLVFDEADAVFAHRTDVRNSTDRYANGEVNTLLMELERFPGIVILTTNHVDVFDPALERRIRYKVHFDPPEAAARAAIWREHLPHEAPVARDADFDRLAAEFELTGGQIANAVMTAASLAAARINGDDDTTEITMADFRRAAEAEKRGFASVDGSRPMGFR